MRGEKVACIYDATSAFDHVDNLGGQSDKQLRTRPCPEPTVVPTLSG